MLQDIRFALRQMRARPLFALAAIALLALGIGASTTVFCVLYQVLLKPSPYPNAQRLVFVHNYFPKNQVASTGVSGFDYAEMRKRSEIFAQSGIYFYNDLTLTGLGPAQHIDVVDVSASLFPTLGAVPALGRLFTEADDRDGAAGVMILSDSFWRSAFNADPRVLNRVVRLHDTPYTVVGVMPPSFQFPSSETQIWIPMALRAGSFTIEGGRSEKWLRMVARLAPGITPESANAALAPIAQELGSRFQAFYPTKDGWRFGVHALIAEQTQSVRRWLYLAFAAVFCVLLIAAFNVTGLLLIRSTARQSEMAIRRALGARPTRVAMQMFTETAVLAFLGCFLAIILCLWAIHLVNVYGPLKQPVPTLTWALFFAPAIALFTTAVVGFVPALLASRASLYGTMKKGTGATGLREAVMAFQIALAVTLIFAALELNRSFLNLTRVPPGFETDHVWTGCLDFPVHHSTTPQSWDTEFYEPLVASLRIVPGVKMSAAGNTIPFNPSGVWTEAISLPGRPKPPIPLEAETSGLVLPGYFETLGIPLRRGRTFSDQDRAGAPRVAVINEELARRYFGADDPIGQTIVVGGAPPATIIGIVDNVHANDLGGPAEPQIYGSELQERTEQMFVILRTEGNLNPANAVRAAIAKLDPGVALYDTQFMETRVASSLALRRFVGALLAGIAFTGLLLSVVGLYASLAHLVDLRQREIGIRVALGATRSMVVRLIASRGAAVVTAGLLIGTFGAALAGVAIRSQLFGVELTDAPIWLAVLAVILFAGAIAAYLPAWRAARIEPSVALRHE